MQPPYEGINKYQSVDLSDVLHSWQWLVADDVTRLDRRVQQIFAEASACGISMDKAEPIIREWFLGIVGDVCRR